MYGYNDADSMLPLLSSTPASGSAACMTHAIIGVSTSELRTPERVVHDPHSEPVQSRELALGLNYPEAIRRAGAVPVIIPPLDLESIDMLLDGLCGLCLSGGPDLHPTLYGALAHPALGPTEAHLDLFEVALVRAAEARQLPVLAICRGLQVLNVARGGTLVQDLPSERPSNVVHRQQQPGRIPTHDVMLESGSLVATALGVLRTCVNSFHHQAIDVLGEGLREVGWADDGVIEAVVAVDRAFPVAVQWHAESMVDSDEQANLLRTFAQASMAYGAGAARAA